MMRKDGNNFYQIASINSIKLKKQIVFLETDIFFRLQLLIEFCVQLANK